MHAKTLLTTRWHLLWISVSRIVLCLTDGSAQRFSGQHCHLTVRRSRVRLYWLISVWVSSSHTGLLPQSEDSKRIVVLIRDTDIVRVCLPTLLLHPFRCFSVFTGATRWQNDPTSRTRALLDVRQPIQARPVQSGSFILTQLTLRDTRFFTTEPPTSIYWLR